jgi:hypothetical protein
VEPPIGIEPMTYALRVTSRKFTVSSPHLPVFAAMCPGVRGNRSLGCSVGCSALTLRAPSLGRVPDNSEALAERQGMTPSAQS